MARVATLETVITARDEASAKFKALSDNAKKNFADTVKSIRNASFQVAAFGAATGFAVTKVVDNFALFNTQIQKAGANVNATAETLEKFRNVAIKAAEGSAVTAEEAARALFFMAGGSVSAEEAAEALAVTLDFATATQVGLEQATILSSQAMTIFNKKGEELNDVLDILTRAGQISFATATQLGDAFQQVAPIASQLGVEIVDLTAIISAMADAGILGSEAGIALKRAFQELLRPSKQMKEGFTRLGVSTNEMQKLLKQPIEIIRLLEQKFGDIQDPIERATVLSGIFGQRSGVAMAALLGLGVDAIDEYRDDLLSAAGATKNAADRIKEAVSPIVLLQEQFQKIGFAIAQAVIPALKSFVESVTPVIEFVSQLIAKFPKLTSFMLLGVIAVGSLAAILAVLSQGILAIILIMPILSAAMLPVIATGAVLVAGILAIIAVFIFWNEIIDFLSDKILQFANFLFLTWVGIKESTINIWNAIIAFFVQTWEGILLIVGEKITETESIIQNKLTAIADFWISVWTGIKDFFTGVWDSITSKIESAVGFVERQVDRIKNLIEGARRIASAPIRIAGSFLRGIAPTIPRQFQEGGIVTQPTIGLIGEAGPEAVIPLNRGVPGNINVTISGNTIFAADADEAARIIGDALIRRLNLQMRIG
jgi:TP901 family phage tail tape measure protein